MFKLEACLRLPFANDAGACTVLGDLGTSDATVLATRAAVKFFYQC